MKTPIYTGIFQSDLDAAGYKLIGLHSPSAASDAATKAYVDSHAGGGGGGTDRKFDVMTYGAVGDGITDDGVAIRAALAAIPATGGVLYFPAGQYLYSGATLTLDRCITVEGDGGGIEASSLTDTPSVTIAVSTITLNSTTGTLFTVTANGCAFKNIELLNSSGTAPSAGAGILVSSGGDRTNYQSITVNGFYINIDVQAGWMQNFEDCYIVAPVLYGLKLRNVSMPDYGDHSISNCQVITARSRAATSAIRIESGGGIKIVNTKINMMAFMAFPWVNGIDLALVAGTITSDLLVSNCSIESFSAVGIKCVTGSGSQWYSTLLTGNQFNPGTNGSQTAISVQGGAANAFVGVTITGNCGGNPFVSSNPMISLGNCSIVALSGNAQTGFSTLYSLGSAVTFADSPVYIGRDARLVSITGGAKLQVRNPGTDTWVDGDSWTNP